MKRDKIYEDLHFSSDFSVEDWNALLKLKLGKYFSDESILEKNKEILRTEIVNYIRFCTKPEYFKLFEWTFDLYKDCIGSDKQRIIKVLADSFDDISNTDMKWMTNVLTQPDEKEFSERDKISYYFKVIDETLEGAFKPRSGFARLFKAGGLVAVKKIYLQTYKKSMSLYLNAMRREIEPLRQQLIKHPVYAETNSIERLRIFMEHHVYAVWDFMSLLKVLQRNLTSIDLPWIPVGNPETRYLINEIVLGEESDVDEQGNRTSHFELYLKAMEEAGCNLHSINTFINRLKEKASVAESLPLANAPLGSTDFVQSTFTVVNNNKPHVQAAVFTFGREDLIPGMFLTFVSELNKQTDNKLGTLKYYLERHIEVDGEHHSHLAYKMTEELNATDILKWQESTDAVKNALLQRIKLWDAIANNYKK